MKIGLILASDIWRAPYMNIYTKILEQLNIDYDVISWNRDGKDKELGYQFQMEMSDISIGKHLKLLPYLKYSFFIKSVVKKNDYDGLIVFNPQIALLLIDLLIKNYKDRYVLDYRDLSIEQNKFLKKPFLALLKNSYANVISSPGFKRCLPKEVEYFLSHNFDAELVKDTLKNTLPHNLSIGDETIKILTIGGIRDYDSNVEVIKGVANQKNILLQFIGKGHASERLKTFAIENNVLNIEFEGYYPKEKEAEYVKQATLLNIFYPRKISHDTALSNRFYNSLIYKKPMIVTSNTLQGDFVEEYSLGLSLERCDNLDSKITEYVKTMDYIQFCQNCNQLLSKFLVDQEILEKKITEFVSAVRRGS